METSQENNWNKQKTDDILNSHEEQKDQQAIIDDNEKALFSEWLQAYLASYKRKSDKKTKFSEEMLRTIDSLGKDIRSWHEYLRKAKSCFNKRMRKPRYPLTKKIDFELFEIFAMGAFSKVLLVKHIDTSNYYAAKSLKKAELVRQKRVNKARSEKLILQSIRFVFTVNLEFFFQDNVYLFFVLPLVLGGELFTYLTKVDRLKEDHARFYSAQMLLALEYLHYCGLIFRDLKPENILIDPIGYLKLTDFGFCKAIDLRTYTLCGTVEYLAPEMWSSRGYGKSVDWWTFGVLLYELCAGYTPFYSKLPVEIYDNISRCKYRFPYHFSTDLRDLIQHILQLDLTRRYGNLKNGVDDIKEHKFYNDIPWIMLLNREIKAPYIPVIAGPDDSSTFEIFADRLSQTASVDSYYEEFAEF